MKSEVSEIDMKVDETKIQKTPLDEKKATPPTDSKEEGKVTFDEPIRLFAPVKLDRIPTFGVTGEDVSEPAIQEAAFLSILNLLPDDAARKEFLQWAKKESMIEKKKETTLKEKIKKVDRPPQIRIRDHKSKTVDVKARPLPATKTAGARKKKKKVKR